jgi:hypothetical protein
MVDSASLGYYEPNGDTAIEKLEIVWFVDGTTTIDAETERVLLLIPARNSLTFTPPGSDVTVGLNDQCWICYDSVSGGGYTDFQTDSTGPPPPDNYDLLPLGLPEFYSITTQVEYDGGVQITIEYDPVPLTGDESGLAMLHYAGKGWETITTQVDTVNNTITGRTATLSVFAIGKSSGCCVLRGDVNSSGAINVADLSYLVDYLFRGGPEPSCPDHGDVNGSGGINVSDLSYLVDYLFRGGSAPVAC